MPYILLVIALAGFGGGFTVARSMYILNIEELKHSIQESNAKQQVLKNINEQKLALAEEKAVKLNENLDKSHESYIETVNSYATKLSSSKLYDHKASCGNKVSEGSNSKQLAKTRTNNSELSRELTEFLRAETLRADKAAIDKNSLLEFVKSNCGIGG
jgi:hypothetical protein